MLSFQNSSETPHLSDFITTEARNRVNIHDVGVPTFCIDELGRICPLSRMDHPYEEEGEFQKCITTGEQKFGSFLDKLKSGEFDGKHIYFQEIFVSKHSGENIIRYAVMDLSNTTFTEDKGWKENPHKKATT